MQAIKRKGAIFDTASISSISQNSSQPSSMSPDKPILIVDDNMFEEGELI